MSGKTSEDILFTQWLHNKYSGLRSSENILAQTLVNMIIINDLDVDIKDTHQLYTDVISFLRLNARSGEFVDFFKKVWEEYRKQTFHLEYNI